MRRCLRKACPTPRGGTPKILISILATNPTYIFHTMLENIQKHMCALIVQHGSALATLAALQQQPKVERNVVYKEVLEM